VLVGRLNLVVCRLLLRKHVLILQCDFSQCHLTLAVLFLATFLLCVLGGLSNGDDAKQIGLYGMHIDITGGNLLTLSNLLVFRLLAQGQRG